ncbi:hypothetical protein MIR68_001827 [Amoeboaphelidium protococcarum]|nr:hypothetical protein MIR68_001827 [Amoeboaphelidium protococcarum]
MTQSETASEWIQDPLQQLSRLNRDLRELTSVADELVNKIPSLNDGKLVGKNQLVTGVLMVTNNGLTPLYYPSNYLNADGEVQCSDYRFSALQSGAASFCSDNCLSETQRLSECNAFEAVLCPGFDATRRRDLAESCDVDLDLGGLKLDDGGVNNGVKFQLLVYNTEVQLLLNNVVEVIAVYSSYDEDEPKRNTLEVLALRMFSPAIQGGGWLIKGCEYQKPQLYRVNSGETRSQLLSFLTDSLFPNDEKAAELSLLWLISKVYHRRADSVLGQVSCTIYDVQDAAFSSKVRNVVQLLTGVLNYVSLTLANLNSDSFVPKYVQSDDMKQDCFGRISESPLMLPSSGHVILDETQLDDGKLSEVGMKNLQSLSEGVLQNSSLEYCNADSKAVSSGVQVNLEWSVLMLSKVSRPPQMNAADAKNISLSQILATSLYIKAPNQEPTHLPQLPGSLIEQFRRYVHCCRDQDSKYNVLPEIGDQIVNDYVQMRRDSIQSSTSTPVDQDTLKLLMELSRLQCLSHGESELTIDHYHQAKHLLKM